LKRLAAKNAQFAIFQKKLRFKVFVFSTAFAGKEQQLT